MVVTGEVDGEYESQFKVVFKSTMVYIIFFKL